MSDPSDAMQAAMALALAGAAPVTALVGGRIYDSVPQEPTYPYIRIGDDQSVGEDNSCDKAWEFYATLHIFARQIANLGARPLAKQIGAVARAALVDALPAPTGFRVVEAQFRDLRAYMEADGVTAHGVLVLRYKVTPA